MPDNFNIQRVLIAPLDWGLGHATRCIPLVRSLLHNGFEVLIAVEGMQEALLRKEFPTITFLHLDGYKVRYSRQRWMLPLKLLVQLPRLKSIVKQEHVWLERIIPEHQIDLVISDNRYGLYTTQKPCIFITHQLTIRAPYLWLEKVLQKLNYRYINRFTACWIPDVEGNENIAGALSHPKIFPDIPVHYMGLLSRFHFQAEPPVYDICVALSGPEPQRTILEKKILLDLTDFKGKVFLVRGKPGLTEEIIAGNNITIRNHLSTQELQSVFLQSHYIISRSGYTTVMELLPLHKKMILVPTPGQTEQEYLAKRLNEQGWCIYSKQDELEILKNMAQAKTFNYQFPAFKIFSTADLNRLLKETLC